MMHRYHFFTEWGQYACLQIGSYGCRVIGKLIKPCSLHAWGRKKISCFQFVCFALITAGIFHQPGVEFNRSDGKNWGGERFFLAPRRRLDLARVDPRSPAQWLLISQSTDVRDSVFACRCSRATLPAAIIRISGYLAANVQLIHAGPTGRTRHIKIHWPWQGCVPLRSISVSRSCG